MGVVLALLAMEVGAAIMITAAVFGAEALLRGPCLDQRPIDRKMLVRQQRLNLRMVQKLAHELGKYVAFLQPVAVLGEGGWVPHQVIRRSPTNQRYKRL